MKTFKIAHLYYDLLNMYGENGNVKALVKKLEEQKVKVTVDFLSLDNSINFDNYDLFYFGSGTKENLNLATKHLMPYKKDILKAIANHKYFIITGTGLEVIANLNILNFQLQETDFQIIGEQVYTTNLIKEKIIGFQNRNTVITNCQETPLFKVITGTGYTPKEKLEGIKRNNFYATYLLGPLFIRNPYLLQYLIKHILGKDYKKTKKDISFKAYQEFLKNFVEEKV